jgi:hypothetical protein
MPTHKLGATRAARIRFGLSEYMTRWVLDICLSKLHDSTSHRIRTVLLQPHSSIPLNCSGSGSHIWEILGTILDLAWKISDIAVLVGTDMIEKGRSGR